MSWQDALNEALARYLVEQGWTDVARVVSFQEETRSGGYCDTCYYEEIVVQVVYLDHNGRTNEAVIYDNFASLITYLT